MIGQPALSAAASHPGPPAPPAVQRLRVRYAKRGRLRFTSHRDFQRAFERALRRAGVPMAYSAGFSPHPKISYAGAAPTGVASEAEYLEIAVTERCDPDRLRDGAGRGPAARLDVWRSWRRTGAAWPTGWRPRCGRSSSRGGRRDRGRAPCRPSSPPSVSRSSRLTKNGLRTFDARAAVRRLEVVAEPRGSTPGLAPVRYFDWSCGTSHLPYDPTMSSPGSVSGRPRAAGDHRGHPAGAGAARRAVRHGVRSTGTGPGPRRRLIDDCQHAGHRLRREARRDRDDFRPRERAGTTTVPVRRWTTRVLRETSRPTWPGNMTGD